MKTTFYTNEDFRFACVDEFFTNFNEVLDICKGIELHTSEKYPWKSIYKSSSWPGFRSGPMNKINIEFQNMFVKQFQNKFGDYFRGLPFEVDMFTHLRLADGKEDWIHTDSPLNYSCLVYMSDTNLNSGTQLYNNKNELIADFRFLQNRAIIFDSRYAHKALNNHGTNIDNGRLTVNAFFTLHKKGTV